MDSLNYEYYAGTNRLRRIRDSVPAGAYPNNIDFSDIDGQADNNYVYDSIGNLVRDNNEQITNIKWSVYGKILEITKNSTGPAAATRILYNYDAAGNRIGKTTEFGNHNLKKYEWYVRDAQGNTIAVYAAESAMNTALPAVSPDVTERHIYGSSLLGTYDDRVNMFNGPNNVSFIAAFHYVRGLRRYQLSNHLGNVEAVITDKKYGVPSGSNSSLIAYYKPDIMMVQDFYPFGWPMPGRTWETKLYRYGFNGKETENDIKGKWNQQDYGMRVYDPRVGRFLSVDPLMNKYPEWSPFAFAMNRPVDGVDLHGLEWAPTPEQEKAARAKATINAIKNITPQNQQAAALNLPPPSSNATLSQGYAPGTWGANESIRLKEQYERDKEMQRRADADPISYGGPGFGRGLVRDPFIQASANSVCPGCGVATGGLTVYVGAKEGNNTMMAQGGLMMLSGGMSFLSQTTSKTETFYRTMSSDDFATFQSTGKIPATGETFISPTAAFSKDYTGVLVQINTKAGTLAQLEQIGVRNAAKLHPNTNLPLVKEGWGQTNAYFKFETNNAGLQQVNIGLGQGKALETFNHNIQNYKVIQKR